MHYREATPDDVGLLYDMLAEAVNWAGDQRVARSDIDHDAQLSRYVRGWQAADDFGVIAVAEAVEPVGAAWARTLPAHEPGYGFVAEDVPELSIAVAGGYRGRGIGRSLLIAIVELARKRGCRALSLSVEKGNRAEQLYRAAGFRAVGLTDNSQTMLLEIRSA